MNVYVCDEVVFDDLVKAADLISRLPSFSLAQLNVVHVDDEHVLYQVVVYCFDDDVKIY